MDTAHLEAAYARRAVARIAAETATATLERGQRLSSAADHKVTDLERRLSTIEAAQAERLAAAITAGRPASALPVDIAADGLTAELTAARSDASVTSMAVESLGRASDQAQAELAIAEAAVVAAIDEILTAEDIEAARLIAYHLDEAVKIGKSLVFGALAAEMSERRQMPPEVTALLERLNCPLIDRRDVAVNLTRSGDMSALARRTARRAEMIAGKSTLAAAAAA